MRVLFCTDTYPPQVNGVSIVTALSVAGLTRLGWECAVAAPEYPEDVRREWQGEPDPPGVQVLSLPSLALPRYPEVRLALPRTSRVHRLTEAFRPDLIHCETEFTLGRMGQIAAARAGVPVVSSYHTDFGRYTEAYGVPWLRRRVSAYLGRFHRRSWRVYTPSTASREEVMRLGAPDVEVWGRGVDTELFHPGRRSQAMRAALGMGSRFTFLYVGRLAPEKRPEQILEAFRLASEVLPKGVIHLIVAGSGPRESELRAAAPPGVSFLGLLERQTQLPDLYANSDAFVFASVTETLGLVVLEAMASGLPVIASPAGGVRDHLVDGENGMACPEGDAAEMARAMIRLTGDWTLSRHLARGARRTAERLSWTREIERLDLSYQEICAGGDTGGLIAGNQAVTVVP
jgi:phosphatidylinositol alpha 1,6-mannosyltransferase